MPLKIAIYCIAKNEEHNVRKFMECVKEADKVLILDTLEATGI